MTNILHISPDFNYSCGVSKHIFLLLSELRKDTHLNLFFITNGGDSLNRLESINIKPVIIKFTRGWVNIIYFISNYFQLKKFCIKKKITIIHSHHRYPELIAYLVAKKLSIKTITTAHSLVLKNRHLSFKSDLIVAVSCAVKHNLINNFRVNKNKIMQLYNFIDVQSFNDKTHDENVKNLNIAVDSRVILFIGRWNISKGVDTLMRSFSILLNKYPKLLLIFVGTFDNLHDQESLISVPNFLFIKSQNSISIYYEISELIVLPSRNESFPYVMLESGMFKKPFIGSNTGGIAEFIEDKKNGLLVEPGNVESLTRAIEWVLDNPEAARQLGENLHKKVLTLNSKEEYIEKLTGIYNELLAT